MKLLHIIGSELPEKSGITSVLRYLPYEQNKIDGVDVKTVSCLLNNRTSRIKNIDYIDVSKFKDYILAFKPDIAILHDFFIFSYAKITRLLRKYKIKYFLEPHGAFGTTALQKSRLKKLIANSTIFKKTIRRASGYIFTTKQERDNSAYHSLVEFIIPNGVVSDSVDESNHKNLDTLHMPVFYFMGRYDINHKGLDYLLDALGILDKQGISLTFNFYGTGAKEEIDYVDSRIQEFKVVKAKNCGTIFGKEKDSEMTKLNILVLTSRYEGSPIVVLEAFSYGNPVIVTPGTNVANEVYQNRLGWSTQLEPHDIASTIAKAMNEYRQNALSYIVRTKKYVLENFTWDRIAKYSVNELQNYLEGNCKK